MNFDILSNKKLNPIVTESFLRGRKLNISFVFFMQSYFAVLKNIRLNSTQYFVMKIPNKKNFNKLHLIIHQILNFRTLWIVMKSVLQTYILFRLLILLLHQITLYILERIEKLIMTIDDKIREEKLQYDIDREAENISIIISKNS